MEKKIRTYTYSTRCELFSNNTTLSIYTQYQPQTSTGTNVWLGFVKTLEKNSKRLFKNTLTEMSNRTKIGMNAVLIVAFKKWHAQLESMTFNLNFI